ncbi:hypothetical protein JCM14469_12090 [Desulfatiferula olefinivorans]
MFEFARENKSLIFLIAFFLLALEVEIFVSAVLKSGDHSKIQVLNDQNEVIYESLEKKLYQFNKYYFEQNFGPLTNYRIRRVEEIRPFPFRAWLISAIGLPIGFMLVLGFLVKAWAVFFKGDSPVYHDGHVPPHPEATGRIGAFIATVSRLNIFVLGFFIVAILFLYWVLPDLILFISRTGVETLIRFKWFFIAAALVLTALVVWFIYLKYLLAKKAIEGRTEIEKMKLQIIHDTHDRDLAMRLIGDGTEADIPGDITDVHRT